jgi:alkylation response protein AidB-like acyl-CoA dehydrogenase
MLFGVPKGTPGLSFVDSWDTLAMRGTGSWDVIFDDVFVPDAAVMLTDPDAPWEGAAEAAFSWFSFTVASIYLGVARAAADFAFDYVSNRTVTGASLPMARQPAQVVSAAEIELLLRPAEALVANGLERRARGETLARDEVSTVKYVAVNNADAAVDRCLRMVGGHGMFRKLPLERYYRDVRAGQFHPPGNDVALETIGKSVLGVPLDAEPRWPAD